jgi:signal transduction histidine kinase
MKEQAFPLKIMPKNERDDHLYNDFTRLNNELATTQRELAKKNHELARLNEQKNQFLGIAAHDLRNPLEIVLTYSQFLLDDDDRSLTDEQIEFINVIRSSSSFMLNLVNDFLDFSKIEAGKLKLELTPVDLPELVRRNVALNQMLAEKKQIEIRFDCRDSLPALMLDESKIEQVLNNLIGNAVKFSPIGDTIDVRVFRREAEAVVSVADKGLGIPAQELDKLFDPFEKGKSKSTGGEKSTGLGLAIVKRIIEGHGGQVAVESGAAAGAGGGTIFYVSVPIQSASTQLS